MPFSIALDFVIFKPSLKLAAITENYRSFSFLFAFLVRTEILVFLCLELSHALACIFSKISTILAAIGEGESALAFHHAIFKLSSEYSAIAKMFYAFS